MTTTISGEYLIVIARYNREYWKNLKKGPEDEREEAEEVAEVLFPEEAIPIPLPAGRTTPAHLLGVRRAQTYDSDIYARIAEGEPQRKSENRPFKDLSMEEKDIILDEIYRSNPPSIPVGWIAVIEVARFLPFIECMSDRNSVLWKIYDIEVRPLKDWTDSDIGSAVQSYPLRDDQTTLDIYNYMTPSNWRT